MQTIETARVYARIACLRRRLMLQQALRRAIAAGIAFLALLVALGFGTAALYLWLLTLMGPIGASCIVACLYLLVAVVLAAFASSRPHSAELDALAQMEAEARLKTGLAVRRLTGIGARAQSLSGTILVAFSLLRTLRRLFRKT